MDQPERLEKFKRINCSASRAIVNLRIIARVCHVPPRRGLGKTDIWQGGNLAFFIHARCWASQG